VTIKEWLSKAGTALKAADSPSPILDAELILLGALSKKQSNLLPKTYLRLHAAEELTEENLADLEELIWRRAQGEPVAYLTGHKDFYGRDFVVDEDVLIPRPETEAFIDILKKLPLSKPQILDLGTGSGVIGLTLALEIPGSKLLLTDVSASALKIALKNSQRLDLSIKLTQSNLFAKIPGKFDVICANLPYVDETWPELSPELKFEPQKALYAGDGGLAVIKKFLPLAPAHLTGAKLLLLEADKRQHQDIITFAEAVNLKHFATKGLILVFKLKD
jgi:release factor glutamine methyltransferase